MKIITQFHMSNSKRYMDIAIYLGIFSLKMHGKFCFIPVLSWNKLIVIVCPTPATFGIDISLCNYLRLKSLHVLLFYHYFIYQVQDCENFLRNL